MKGTVPWLNLPTVPHWDFLSLLVRKDWHSRARCAHHPGVDPYWFTLERTSAQRYSTDLTTAEVRAKRCCALCPVRRECLTEGIREPVGIWGGTLHTERGRYRSLPLEARVDMLLEDMTEEATSQGWVSEEEVA